MELVSYLANVTARSLCLAALALLGVCLFRVKTAAARHAALTVVACGMLLLAALTATLPSVPLRVLRAERAAPAVSPAPDFRVEAVPLPPLTVQPAANRWIVFAELPGLSLVCDLQHRQTESPARRHHGTIDKNLPRIELLLKIGAVLVHQDSLFVGDVLRKSRPGRNQLKEVMLFLHSNGTRHCSAGRSRERR